MILEILIKMGINYLSAKFQVIVVIYKKIIRLSELKESKRIWNWGNS